MAKGVSTPAPAVEVPVRRPTPIRLAVALVVGAAGALALPATAEVTDPATCYQRVVDGPQFCTSQVWFVPGDNKVGNLAAVGAATYPTWTTDEPTSSVATGAGGGYASNGVPRQQNGESNPATGALFKGTYTGDIDNLAATMYLFAPGRQQDPTYYGGVDLVVDGTQVLRIDDELMPLEPGGNAVLKTSFAVSGIQTAMQKAGLATGPDVVHEVELFLTSYAVATTTAAFVYGTSEAPSSMTFNVADLDPRNAYRAS